MKLEATNHQIESSGDFAQTSYKMAMNEFTFRILTKDIYSNPIKAIVRELGTNAYDAHVQVQKENEPFEVHCPTSYEPWFSVKDFGIGMSNEFVENEYTTFFESSKRTSNDVVGCMGLGAKSPFAYTDSFTVTICFNGKRTVWNPIIGSNGVPTIMKLSEEATNECNGTEVKFAVKYDDFGRFRDSISEVYRWFKTTPIIKGYKLTLEPVQNFEYVGANYKIKQNMSSSIVMGNIAYPLDYYQLAAKLGYNDPNKDKVHALINYGVLIYANLGDVSITPSREHLSYDDKTIAYCCKVAGEVADDFVKVMEDKLLSVDSLWKARLLAQKLDNGLFSQLCTSASYKYQGKSVLGQIEVPDGITCIHYFKYGYSRKNKFRDGHTNKVQAHETHKYYLEDIDSTHKAVRGIKKAAENESYPHLYLFSFEPSKQAIWDAFIKDSGLEEAIIKVSSLPPDVFKVVKNTTGVKAKSEKSLLYKLHFDTNWNTKGSAVNYWKSEDVDLKNTEGVYTDIMRFYFDSFSKKFAHISFPSDFKAVHQKIKELDSNFELYGIRTSDNLKMSKFSGWMDLETYIDELLNKHIFLIDNQFGSLDLYGQYQSNAYVYNSIVDFYKKNKKEFVSKKSSSFIDFVDLLMKIPLSDKKHPIMYSLLSLLHDKRYETNLQVLDLKFQDLQNIYPMLKHVGWNVYTKDSVEVANYINDVDERS